MVAGSRRAAWSRGRRRRRDPRRRARHRRRPGRGRRDRRLHRPQHAIELGPTTTAPRRSRRPPSWSRSSAASASRSRSTTSIPTQVRDAGRADPARPRPHRRARQRHLGRRGAQGRPGASGTRRSGSTTSTTGLRILRLAIDTHLITSHHLLPLLIDRPGGLLVEVTDGTADYNASHYRISVFYDLAKVAVNRLAFSQGHELAAARRDRGRDHAGMAALGDDARELRRHRGELARRARSDSRRRPTRRPRRLRALRVAALRRARRRRAGSRSRPGPMEPAVGQLRPARARVRVHRRRRLAARRLALHRGGPRARPRGRPRRLPVSPGRCAGNRHLAPPTPHRTRNHDIATTQQRSTSMTAIELDAARSRGIRRPHGRRRKRRPPVAVDQHRTSDRTVRHAG